MDLAIQKVHSDLNYLPTQFTLGKKKNQKKTRKRNAKK